MNQPFAIVVLLLVLLGSGCVGATKPVSSSASVAIQPATLDLHGQGLTSVSPDVFKQTSISTLNLSSNQLTGSIPAEIRLLERLEFLDLSHNALTGLPAEIGQLKQLRVLNVSQNQLTGLPLELGQLSKLETLDLRGNAYAKQDLDAIRSQLPQTTIILVDN